jgi:2-polyprenyl-6-methoxyphenol hydroxylase-like FAD-dependent oxidoreductase
MNNGDKVVVVGAGPVGLTLACELAAHGVVPRVIDRSRRQTRHSKATVVWPRILELLDRIGVTRGLLDAAQQVAVAEFHGDAGLLKRIDLAELVDSQFPFALTLPQTEIESVLEGRFDELGGVVEREISLVGLDQDADGVRIGLRAKDGGERQVTADWLIGADGAGSTVRGELGCSFPGFAVPIRFMLADAYISRGAKKGVGAYFFGAEGSLATVPIGNGDMFRIAAAVPDDTAEIDAPLLTELLLRRAGLKCTVDSVVNTAFFQAQVRQAESYRFDRVFLAGDAAHLTTPASGQGMNTGIQDAVALGWRLAGVVLGRLDQRELDEYARERRVAVERVQEITTAQTEVVDAGRGVVGSAPLMGPREISQIDTAYPEVGEFPYAGARVPLPFRVNPDPAWPALSALGPTILLWPGHEWSTTEWTSTVDSIVGAMPGHVRVIDLAGKAPGHLSDMVGERPVAVVVRPDGHVANRWAPEEVVAELRGSSPWLIP